MPVPAELLARERAHRRLRRDLPLCCAAMLRRQELAPAAHHRLLLRELAGEARRLMVFMPPGSGKSLYASVLFPAWFLARGRVNVLAAGHTAALAESFSRRVRATAADAPWLGWSPSRAGISDWATTRGGEYRAAGVGAGIAGFRADLGLIDDPVRGRADADSRAVRDAIWDWYRADFLTRLRPGARQVLVMTRWHEDDLAGRLLASGAGDWRVVSLPALAGMNDPLGRAPGAPLWADDGYGYAAQLMQARAFYERTGGLRDWHALYQQDPRPAEGTLFRAERIPVLETPPAIPAGAWMRAWDLAATAASNGGDPDWTVGLLMGRAESGQFVVADILRLRGGPEAVRAAILNTAAADGHGVAVGLPQDPGQAGKAQAADFVRALAGYRVLCSPETGAKAVRAAPAAAQCNVGNLAVLRAAWNAAYLAELRGFPGGGKDDQVDATARALAFLADRAAPGRMARVALIGR